MYGLQNRSKNGGWGQGTGAKGARAARFVPVTFPGDRGVLDGVFAKITALCGAVGKMTKSAHGEVRSANFTVAPIFALVGLRRKLVVVGRHVRRGHRGARVRGRSRLPASMIDHLGMIKCGVGCQYAERD